MTTQEQLQAAVETATNLIEEKYEQASMTGTCSCYKDPDNACASCSAWERVTKQSKEVILTELQPIFDALVNEKQDAETLAQNADVFFEAAKLDLDKANERMKELEQARDDWKCRYESLDRQGFELAKERDHLKQQLEEATQQESRGDEFHDCIAWHEDAANRLELAIGAGDKVTDSANKSWAEQHRRWAKLIRITTGETIK